MANPAPHEDLLSLRSEFPILEHTTYLITNSLGAMPRGVETLSLICRQRGDALTASAMPHEAQSRIDGLL